MKIQVAIVTGAATGLGAAFATHLASIGFDVGVCDLQDAGETLTGISAIGKRGTAVLADAADAEDVRAFAEHVAQELGPPSVLVNNVGISPYTPFGEISLDEWRRVLTVNLDSVFLMTQAFLPAMREAGWGRVVNLASSVAWDAQARDMVHYATTKMGLVGYTRALAAEVGRDGVTVNCLAPGLVRTPLLEQRVPAQRWEQTVGRQALPRALVPEDLLGALGFLVSPGADAVTGTCLPINGGRVWV